MTRATSGAQSKGGRATKSKTPASSKAAHIVELVRALSGELGVQDGAYLGRKLAVLLSDVYVERRRAVPRWVQELLTHYRVKGGSS